MSPLIAMTGVPLGVPAMAPKFEELRAESLRLRAEMQRVRLEICMTVAGFGDGRSVGEKLRASSHRAAVCGCEIIRTELPMVSGEIREDLVRKLKWLEGRCQDAETVESPVAVSEWIEEEPETRLTPAGPVTNGPGEVLEKLTRRETEVLKCIAEGNSTKRVAEMLGITFKTAACHRYRVMDKLGIHETANLVRYAIRQGLIQP